MLRDLTGYPLTCSNEEALKYFNDGAFAIITLRENGFPILVKAAKLDDSIVVAHCIIVMFLMEGLEPPNSPNVSPHLDAIKSALSSRGDQLTPREHAYIRAALAFSKGNMLTGTEELRNMLVDYPLDALALRINVGLYITLGEYERMRDMMASALVFWTEDMTMYPFVLGYYGFGLEECRERDLAEEVTRKSLAMDSRNAFATHALTHVIEEARDAKSGVEFLTTTREDWRESMFGGHITWHLTLYYFDLGDMESLFHEFDEVLFENAKPENAFGLLDAASLLWRLNVLGIEVGEKRWKRVTDAATAHIDNTKARSPWLDTHIMMGLAHGKVSECTARLALAQGMIKNIENYSKTDGVVHRDISEKVGVPVCNALLAFGQERYDEVLQIMLPLRYDFIRFGGSWAQRQAFNFTMIQAAIRANKLSVALALVTELKAQKPESKRLKKMFDEIKSINGSQAKSLPSTQD